MSGESQDNDTRDHVPLAGNTPFVCDYRIISPPAEDILNKQMMTTAYAIGVVILSIGIVILTLTLAVLCFLYPDKANAFMVLLGSPVVLLIVSNSFRLGRLIKTSKVADTDIKELQDVNDIKR